MAFENTGNEAFEYYKLELEFDSKGIQLEETNKTYQNSVSLLLPRVDLHRYRIHGKGITYKFVIGDPVLVPADSRTFSFYLKTPAKIAQFPIRYRFLSKDYSAQGEINCKVLPEYEELVEFKESEGRLKKDSFRIEDIIETVHGHQK